MSHRPHRHGRWNGLKSLSFFVLPLLLAGMSKAQLPVSIDSHSTTAISEDRRFDVIDALTPNGSSKVSRYSLPQHPLQSLQPSLAISSGYDSASNDIPNAAGGVALVEGKLVLDLRKERSNLLIQHDGQLVESINTGIGLQQYQRTSVVFEDRASRSTTWTLLAENGYGSDAARDVGNLNTATLNTVSVPDTNTVAYGIVSGNTLSDRALLSFDHRQSETRTLSIGGDAAFHHYFNQDLSDQRYSANVGLRTDLSNTATVGLRAEGVREHYNALNCTTASITAFANLSLDRYTRLEGGVGPILGSDECSGNYQYNVTLSKRTPTGTTVYIGSTRQVSDGFVNQSTWENANFGGVSFGHTRTALVSFDAGYARYELANPTPTNPNLHGYFASGELRRRLNNAAELSITGRYFSRGPSPAQLSRAVILLTYRWSREERPMKISDGGARNETF